MSFWREHCPARPKDLLHKHERDCSDGHLPDQCCECGQRAGQVEVVEEPVEPAGEIAPPSDDAPREPKLIDGDPGRPFRLTEREKARLTVLALQKRPP